MPKRLTYMLRKCDDLKPTRGTLRVWFDDDRQAWGISPPGDLYYSTAVTHWRPNGGEVFGGEKWVPMSDWEGWND